MQYISCYIFHTMPTIPHVSPQVYTMVVQFESGLFEYIPTSLVVDAAPTLKKHHDLVLTHPKVSENKYRLQQRQR